jgi:AraC-like DNA-binding protein
MAIIILIGFTIRLTVDRFPQIAESVQIIIQDENNQLTKFKKEIILTDHQLKIYSKIINQYISTKPTRDTKFNKNQLISAVCLPEYLVNCYFNQHLGTSFGNWKTNQRIIDGIDLIQQGFLKSKTIESLAKEVGFSSRSRFVEAFVKIQGCTPSDYHASYFK